MKIIRKISNLRKTLHAYRRQRKKIGFVPTMGALHEGHLALLRQSRKENDLTVLSIFVNPTQFGPNEDYKTYPRTWKIDLQKAEAAGVDSLFSPTVPEMYPAGCVSWVNVDENLTSTLCGASRPGHFRGVATVVAKLLNIVQPNRLYLGQKDAQQCAVIQKLVKDLNYPVAVRIHPTVREKDGLAMSSRNRYLKPQERREATALNQALCLGKAAIAAGKKNPAHVITLMRRYIQNHSSGIIDYIACVDPATLQPLKTINQKTLLAVAVRFGKTRLIDNRLVPTYNV